MSEATNLVVSTLRSYCCRVASLFAIQLTLFLRQGQVGASTFDTEAFTSILDSGICESGGGNLTHGVAKLLAYICERGEEFEVGYDTVSDENRAESNSRKIVETLCEKMVVKMESLVTTINTDFTEEELMVCNALGGKLYEASDGSESKKNAKESKNVKRDTKTKKGKGDFGAGAEEEEWERELKKEQEAKQKQQAAKEERVYSKDELKIIEKQSALRARIGAIVRQLSNYMSVLNTMATASIGVTNDIILPRT